MLTQGERGRLGLAIGIVVMLLGLCPWLFLALNGFSWEAAYEGNSERFKSEIASEGIFRKGMVILGVVVPGAGAITIRESLSQIRQGRAAERAKWRGSQKPPA